MSKTQMESIVNQWKLHSIALPKPRVPVATGTHGVPMPHVPPVVPSKTLVERLRKAASVSALPSLPSSSQNGVSLTQNMKKHISGQSSQQPSSGQLHQQLPQFGQQGHGVDDGVNPFAQFHLPNAGAPLTLSSTDQALQRKIMSALGHSPSAQQKGFIPIPHPSSPDTPLHAHILDWVHNNPSKVKVMSPEQQAKLHRLVELEHQQAMLRVQQQQHKQHQPQFTPQQMEEMMLQQGLDPNDPFHQQQFQQQLQQRVGSGGGQKDTENAKSPPNCAMMMMPGMMNQGYNNQYGYGNNYDPYYGGGNNYNNYGGQYGGQYGQIDPRCYTGGNIAGMVGAGVATSAISMLPSLLPLAFQYHQARNQLEEQRRAVEAQVQAQKELRATLLQQAFAQALAGQTTQNTPMPPMSTGMGASMGGGAIDAFGMPGGMSNGFGGASPMATGTGAGQFGSTASPLF